MTAHGTHAGAPARKPPTLEQRVARLRLLDWDLTQARTQGGTHGIHPYPAKFIPQIPRQLIAELAPRDGSIVLDPFCGSGTTLLEAQAAGISALGIDSNPLATLIASVKTHRPTRALGPLAAQLVREARSHQAPIPTIPRLDHWFDPDVQQALANIVSVVREVDDGTVRDALQIALSSVIVRVSNQESDTRYAAITKDVTGASAYEGFLRAAIGMDAAYEEQFGGLFSSTPSNVRLLTKNVLNVTPEDVGARVGLVVTSPPYPNAYEYWLYHKYRMYWLGHDPVAVREVEIGARPHYFKKNHQTENDFELQMGLVFRLISLVSTRQAAVAMLVGRSIIHGRTIDNQAILKRAAARAGFKLAVTMERSIPSHRKSFNPSHSKIGSEAIMVFSQ